MQYEHGPVVSSGTSHRRFRVLSTIVKKRHRQVEIIVAHRQFTQEVGGRMFRRLMSVPGCDSLICVACSR
jgi:hypothetical protein